MQVNCTFFSCSSGNLLCHYISTSGQEEDLILQVCTIKHGEKLLHDARDVEVGFAATWVNALMNGWLTFCVLL